MLQVNTGLKLYIKLTNFHSGLEKYELLAKQAGNEDPFFLKAVQRGKVSLNYSNRPVIPVFPIQSTKAEPTIVNATDNYRMVGCVCNEEDTNIKWTWLCEVGWWIHCGIL